MSSWWDVKVRSNQYGEQRAKVVEVIIHGDFTFLIEAVGRNWGVVHRHQRSFVKFHSNEEEEKRGGGRFPLFLLPHMGVFWKVKRFAVRPDLESFLERCFLRKSSYRSLDPPWVSHLLPGVAIAQCSYLF